MNAGLVWLYICSNSPQVHPKSNRTHLLSPSLSGGFCIAAINKIYCNLRTLHYNFPIIEIAILKYDMPKFMTWIPTVVVSEDCLGSATALNGVEVNYNREIYHIEDSTLFMDEEHPENGMVPYEGQENANFLYVGKWYENGELQTLVLCEHIPM